MKKKILRILRLLGLILAALLVFCIAKRLLWGRLNLNGDRSGIPEEIEITWEQAREDGVITEEEIADHFAPEINAAVNVLLSCGGKGDFITAADYDGDLNAGNNWEGLSSYPLNAYVYYSVQETATHYYVGYYFYHPRDDAEIWLDRHENDFEGIMLSIRKQADGFGEIEAMYTQGHGKLPFYYDDDSFSITEGSRYAGGLEINGSHPVIYITPNGTLNKAGHSVESDKDHTTYLYVGNSGIFYYNGGTAEEPATFNGAYESNPCSYALVSIDELYQYRNGPYGEGNLFAAFSDFYGDTWEENAANPAWGWRNKTDFGFSGSFLSDPAWTFTKAIDGMTDVSHDYISNDYAAYEITVDSVECRDLPAGTTVYVCIARDGYPMSNAGWWSAVTEGEPAVYPVSFGDTSTIWLDASSASAVEIYVCDADGSRLSEDEASVQAEIIPLSR